MTSALEVAQWEQAPVEYWRRAWRIPRLSVYGRAPSTNDIIKQAAAEGAPAGTTAIADFQTAGRGRQGRAWIAPTGAALLMSVLLRPPTPAGEFAGALPIRVGLALARALRTAAGVDVTLKWPNDMLAGGAKLAGILCEAAGNHVVVGIGANVRQQVADFSPELRGLATSIRIITGLGCSRADLAGVVLEELRFLFEHAPGPLSRRELECFAALDALAGRQLAVDGHAAGVGAGIDRYGALLVIGPAGTSPIHAGSVRITA